MGARATLAGSRPVSSRSTPHSGQTRISPASAPTSSGKVAAHSGHVTVVMDCLLAPSSISPGLRWLRPEKEKGPPGKEGLIWPWRYVLKKRSAVPQHTPPSFPWGEVARTTGARLGCAHLRHALPILS